MRIIKASAKNFLSFLDFNYTYSAQGLTNIDGHDDDLDVKTGAGKSGFLDVICYAFFGKTSKDLKADEVINWETKKNMELHLSFERDGVWEVNRYRKHKEHENDFFLVSPEGQEVRGKDVKETQKILERLLGFDYEIFKRTIYFGQFDDVDKFLSATDKEKKDLISTVCDLSSYDNKLDLVKAEIKEDSDQLSEIKQKHQILESSYNTLDNQLCAAGKQMNIWNEQQKEKISSIEAKIVLEDEEIKKSIKEIEENSINWDKEKSLNISKIEGEIKNWDDTHLQKIKQLEDESNSWSLNQDSLVRVMSQDLHKIQDELKQAQEEYNRESSIPFEDLSGKIKEIEEKIHSLEQLKLQGDSLYAQQQHLVKVNDALKVAIAGENQKKAEGEGSECPHCYQSITGEAIDRKIQSLYIEGKARKKEIEDFQVQLDNINKSMMVVAEYRDELKRLVEKQNNDKIRQMELRGLGDKVRGLERSLEDKNRSIDNEKNRINPFSNSISEIKEQKNPHLDRRQILINEENPFLPQLDAAKKRVNPFPDQLEALREEKNPFLIQVSDLEKELKEKEYELREYELKIEDLNYKISLGEFWKAGLGTYIKSMLMDSFLEQLNIQANQYLETLFGGVLKVELSSVTEGKKGVKEKINQRIFNGNHECSYNSLSGGERCRICLAVNLALSDITCKSLGQSFSLLMLDEIFNGLDSVGKTQTMKLLKELESRFETILVIDHTEEFKSLFSNVITVRKKGGVSTIIQ